MSTKLKMIIAAEKNTSKTEGRYQICAENWTRMFGDRATFVLEDAMKVLGAIQARMVAGKNPFEMVPGNEKSLVDVVAGVKALQAAGEGGDTMALKSYMQRTQGQKQGLTPDQLEIEAIKQAGANSRVEPQIQQAMNDFAQAVQTGDQKRMEQLKQEFSKLFLFYQNLQARMKPALTTTNTPTPQQVAPAQQPKPPGLAVGTKVGTGQPQAGGVGTAGKGTF